MGERHDDPIPIGDDRYCVIGRVRPEKQVLLSYYLDCHDGGRVVVSIGPRDQAT